MLPPLSAACLAPSLAWHRHPGLRTAPTLAFQPPTRPHTAPRTPRCTRICRTISLHQSSCNRHCHDTLLNTVKAILASMAQASWTGVNIVYSQHSGCSGMTDNSHGNDPGVSHHTASLRLQWPAEETSQQPRAHKPCFFPFSHSPMYFWPFSKRYTPRPVGRSCL